LKKAAVSDCILVLLLASFFAGFVNLGKTEAGTIYIRADGRIEGTTNIVTVDNVTYTFTNNIFGEVVVEKDDIVVDGNGFSLQGIGAEDSRGIYLLGRSNVTIMNSEIRAYSTGIFFINSSYSTIVANTITGNAIGIVLSESSFNNISGNKITANLGEDIGSGIWLFYFSENNDIIQNNITNNLFQGVNLFHFSNNNKILGNKITGNGRGIELEASKNNGISRNQIVENEYGIFKFGSLNNTIYFNDLINNKRQVFIPTSVCACFWDNGSHGNYWSDYQTKNPDATEINGLGIWNTPYVIDENNQDNYPLTSPLGFVDEEEEQEKGIPFWTQWWFGTIVATVIVALAGIVYLLLMKRKPPIPTTPPLPTEVTIESIVLTRVKHGKT
jgi:parallel beta-helix repeat protein